MMGDEPTTTADPHIKHTTRDPILDSGTIPEPTPNIPTTAKMCEGGEEIIPLTEEEQRSSIYISPIIPALRTCGSRDKLTETECVAVGGHCWDEEEYIEKHKEPIGWSYYFEPRYIRTCKHCGKREKKIPERWEECK